MAITRCELLNSSKLENAVNFTSLGMQNQFLSMHDINVKTKLFWHPVYIAMLAMHKVKLVAAAKCHQVIRENQAVMFHQGDDGPKCQRRLFAGN